MTIQNIRGSMIGDNYSREKPTGYVFLAKVQENNNPAEKTLSNGSLPKSFFFFYGMVL